MTETYTDDEKIKDNINDALNEEFLNPEIVNAYHDSLPVFFKALLSIVQMDTENNKQRTKSDFESGVKYMEILEGQLEFLREQFQNTKELDKESISKQMSHILEMIHKERQDQREQTNIESDKQKSQSLHFAKIAVTALGGIVLFAEAIKNKDSVKEIASEIASNLKKN